MTRWRCRALRPLDWLAHYCGTVALAPPDYLDQVAVPRRVRQREPDAGAPVAPEDHRRAEAERADHGGGEVGSAAGHEVVLGARSQRRSGGFAAPGHVDRGGDKASVHEGRQQRAAEAALGARRIAVEAERELRGSGGSSSSSGGGGGGG